MSLFSNSAGLGQDEEALERMDECTPLPGDYRTLPLLRPPPQPTVTITSTNLVNRSITSNELFYATNPDGSVVGSYTLTEEIICHAKEGPWIRLSKTWHHRNGGLPVTVDSFPIAIDTELRVDPVFKGIQARLVHKDTYLFVNAHKVAWLIVGPGNRCEVMTGAEYLR